MNAACFVLLNVLVRAIDGVQPKSVNLALETVLQFDKKNYDVDVNVINKVQKFLDTVKKHVVKNGRRRSSNQLKLTDFIKESAKILKECKDSDLEDMFAVLDDEIRKYHYKGCKFYELVEDVNVRRYMTTQLAQAKGAKAGELKKGLEKVVITIENDTFNGKDKSLMQMLNSLYTGSDRIFRSVLYGLEKYKVKGAEGMNLPQFLSSSLRTLLFDHYSKLNSNARDNVKNVVNSYLKPTNAKVLYNSGNGNKKAGLRMISVDGFTNKAMNAWSRYVLRNTKPTYRPVLRDIVDNIFEKMGTKQKRYKVTDATEETEAPTTTEVTTTEVTTTEPTTTHTTPSARSTILSFDDEDYTASESQETETVQPKGKGNKHVLRMKSTTQDDEELFLNPREFTMLSPEKDYTVARPVKKNKKIKPKVVNVNETEKESLTIEIVGNNAKGAASIDIISSETTTDANRLEIIERDFHDGKDNTVKVKAKKQPYVESQVTNYYGQAINYNGGFLSDEEAALKQDPLSLEHLSIETKARESIEVDTDSVKLLVGGQDIKTMIYRSDLVTKKVSVLDNEKEDKKLKHIESHFRHRDKNDENMKTAKVHEHKLNIKHKENQDKVTKNKSRHNRHKEKKRDDSIGIDSFVMKNDFIGVETVGYKVKNPEERNEIRSSVRHKVNKHEDTVELETVGSVVNKPMKDVKWDKVVVMKFEHLKESKLNEGDKETKPEDSVEIKFVQSFSHKPQKYVELKSVSHNPKSDEPQGINVKHKANKHKKLVEIDNVGSVDHKPKKRVKSEELGIIKPKEVIKPSHQHKIKEPKYSIEIDHLTSVDQQPKKHVKSKDIKELKSEEAVENKPNIGYKVKKHKDLIEVDDIRSVDHQPKKHVKSKDMKVIKSEEAVDIKPNHRYKVKTNKDSIEINDIRSVDHQPKKYVKLKDIKVIKSGEVVEKEPNFRYKVKKHKDSIEIDDIRTVNHQPKKHVKSKNIEVMKSEEAVEIEPNLQYNENKHRPLDIEFVEKIEVIKSEEPKQINPKQNVNIHNKLVEIANVGSVNHKPKKRVKSKELEIIKNIKPSQNKIEKPKYSIEIDDARSVNHKPKKHVKSKDIKVTKSEEAIEIKHNLRYKVKKHKNSIEIGDIRSDDNEPNKHEESEQVKVHSAESKEVRSRYWYKFNKNEEPVLKAHEINKNIEPYATRNKEDTSEQIQEILTEHSAVIKVEAPRGLKESATSDQKVTQKPVHDEAKHIVKHKKASHKKKTHKSSSSEVKVNARRSLNNIETQDALGAILKPNPNEQTDKGGLKIKEPFDAEENQQMKRLDEKEASNLLDKTQQENISLASSTALLISTEKPKEKQEVINQDNVEKILTPTKMEIINVSTPWTTINIKPAPLVRRQDNPNISSNAVNKETPLHVQGDVGKIIDNINMISKDNITSDTLVNLFKLKDMIVTHPELKEKWNSIQTLNNVESKTQETSSHKSIMEGSSQNQPLKEFSQMKDSIMDPNFDNLGNVTAGTSKVEMAVTLGGDMKKQWDTLKKEWDSLKTDMALKDPKTTKGT